MAALTLREQTLIHALKALTDGEIGDWSEERKSDSRTVKAGPQLDTRSGDTEDQQVAVYTDPEDIEFGEPVPRLKRSEQLIVLAWTRDRHKILKTKKRAHQLMKVWRRWYERQGWTVKNFGDAESMIAVSLTGDRHAITLRTYKKK